jgi:hypothetical protein
VGIVGSMARSREGNGRHRQAWIEITCEHCGQTAKARRTVPGRPLHIFAHLTDNGPCPPLRHGLTLEQVARPTPRRPRGQLTLF